MARASLSGFGILLCAALILQTKTAVSQQSPPVTAPAGKYRAVLDQYCVTCHNDKTKRANLSLENVDPATIGDHPEVWEKVIRKLRAGVMPPPGVRRPPLTDYEGLRDWLENEIDQKAAARGVNPGYVVLHRLNRTEYANVIRDLVDIEIDPAKFLPPDDSARGFDNVAGSLTISPTLLEAYTTAATRIARMAVGYWKAPTEASYIAPGDVGQTSHIEGLPLGTRGGMLVRHNFPSDGEYKFSIQNFGVGTYWPGEKVEFLVDGERVKLVDYVGVGLSKGMASVEPLMPVDYAIGVGTFLPNNSVEPHPETAELMLRLMKERGIKHTTSECTLRGFTCSIANVDPKTATPAEIAKVRRLATGNQVVGITGGLEVKEKEKEQDKPKK